MSETPTEAPETGAEATTEEQQQPQKPTETLDFWKQKAREQEKRAKENAAAAKRLTELEEAQKSEAEKAADRIAKAEAEVSSVPAKVADGLRSHLVTLHEIDAEDAELFLTATDPDLLLKQVDRLLGQSGKRNRKNHVPREGDNPSAAPSDDAAFARDFLGG